MRRSGRRSCANCGRAPCRRVGAPRPDAATSDALASWLETTLDHAAAANPDPGRPALHRLNRAEYSNAIRDSAGDRRGRVCAAAAGRFEQRLRQQRGRARRLARAAGALSRRRAQDRCARGRRSGDQPEHRHLPDPRRHVAGRSHRRACRSGRAAASSCATTSRSTVSTSSASSCLKRRSRRSAASSFRTPWRFWWTARACTRRRSGATPSSLLRRSTPPTSSMRSKPG